MSTFAPRAVDELLLRKADELLVLEEVGALHHSGRSERPARATDRLHHQCTSELTSIRYRTASAAHLILHRRHGSVQAPVPLVGQRGREAPHFGRRVRERRRAEWKSGRRLAHFRWRGAEAAQRAQFGGRPVREVVHRQPVALLAPVRGMDESAEEQITIL